MSSKRQKTCRSGRRIQPQDRGPDPLCPKMYNHLHVSIGPANRTDFLQAKRWAPVPNAGRRHRSQVLSSCISLGWICTRRTKMEVARIILPMCRFGMHSKLLHLKRRWGCTTLLRSCFVWRLVHYEDMWFGQEAFLRADLLPLHWESNVYSLWLYACVQT